MVFLAFTNIARYPNICCDVLCSDIPSVAEALCHQESLLDLLVGFLYRTEEQPMAPKLANYCAKVALSLFSRKPKDMAVYIQAKKDIIIKMVEGLRSQGVPELLIKVATSEEVPGLQQVPPIIFFVC